MGIKTSTFGIKTLWILPEVICIQTRAAVCPARLRETRLPCGARSTSAFRGSFLRPRGLPARVQRGGARGWGWEFLFYILMGSAEGSRRPRPDLTVGDTRVRTAVGTGSLPAGSLLREVDRSLPLALPPRRAATSFVRGPFYLLDTAVHFGCTFFSNSHGFTSETPPSSSPACCVHEGPLG